MKFIVLLTIVVVAGFTQDMKPDTRTYHWPTNNVEAFAKVPRSLKMEAAVNVEDLNVTNSFHLIQPDPHYTTLEWYQSGAVAGWRILESQDLREWKTNQTVWNDYINQNFRKQTVTFTTNNPVFWRIQPFGY